MRRTGIYHWGSARGGRISLVDLRPTSNNAPAAKTGRVAAGICGMASITNQPGSRGDGLLAYFENDSPAAQYKQSSQLRKAVISNPPRVCSDTVGMCKSLAKACVAFQACVNGSQPGRGQLIRRLQ